MLISEAPEDEASCLTMTLRDWKLRLRALLAPRQVEKELDDELAFHVECETEKLISQGVNPADARARARARFGSVALAADNCRDTRGTAFIDNTVRDAITRFVPLPARRWLR